MKELALYLIKNVADRPEAVSISESEENGVVHLRITTAEEDKGRIIGKEGRIIKAVRALVGVLATKQGKRSYVQVD